MAEAVRVLVRCRPMNQREKQLKCKSIVNVDEERNAVSLLSKTKDSDNQTPKQFTFDGAYGNASKTSNIYAETTAALVESVLEGFNATVFAYGQTGCGKSFTMEGPESLQSLTSDQSQAQDQTGIIPRACADLFDSVALSNNTKKFLVHASYLEIYNENVRDLLIQSDSRTPRSQLELKEHPEKGVYIKGLSMHRVTSAQMSQKLMSRGWSQRVTGETLMNMDSSRSHAIFTLYVETEEDDNIRAGKLHLVDLAGSERQSKTNSTGIRLKEAAKINLSLSALGNVISALVDGKAKHIPYRDSKLTRILQDSLGGNTKTLMIACISPADNNYEETLSTLRYANRAKKIKNIPKINEDPKDALLRQYQDEISQLKKLLQSQLGTAGLKQLIQNQKSGGVVGQESKESVSVTVGEEQEAATGREAFVTESREQMVLEEQLANAVQRAEKESAMRIKLEKELTSMKRLREKGWNGRTGEDSQRRVQQPRLDLRSPEILELKDGKNSPLAEEESTAGSSPVAQKVVSQTLTNTLCKSGSISSTAEIQPASEEHEKYLKRLLELQRGFVRSTHISNDVIQSIRSKKSVIKNKQVAAEKRRLLAKKAVEAQNDEEMFHALFENVHEDVRSQKRSLDKAKSAIKSLQEESRDLHQEFERERAQLLESMRTDRKEILLLESILEKIQPTIKRDCNYSNIDKIKKNAVWDEEKELWNVPKLSLQESQGALPMVTESNLSARQMQLMSQNRKSSVQQSPISTFRDLVRKPPRRLQPMNNPNMYDF